MLGRFRVPGLREVYGQFLHRPRHVLGAFALPLGLLWLAATFGARDLEFSIKLAGFGLNIAGLGQVAFGLYLTRREFGRPSYRQEAAQWSRDALSLFQPRKSVVADYVITPRAGGVEIAGAAPTVSVSGSIEGRVAALEAQHSAMDARISAMRGEFQTSVENLRHSLAANDRALSKTVADLAKQLEDFSVGGLDLEAMGLIWLLCGAVLSTFAEEIAGWAFLQ